MFVCLGGSDIERVNCTACGQQVNHFQRDSVYQHPALKVLICKVCVCVLYEHLRLQSSVYIVEYPIILIDACL